ncbi:hypothetical protein BHE74_00029545 [Ensete ventricosum]|nr:hypothetical protein BHE74_00029545 [Ensete ventricosum]
MASLLLPPGSSLLSPCSAAAAAAAASSSSSRHRFLFASTGNLRKSSHRRKFFLPAAAAVLDEAPVFDPSLGFPESQDVIAPWKLKLLVNALRPSSNTGSGEFEVTYLDSDTRITPGDRGELRVFVSS